MINKQQIIYVGVSAVVIILTFLGGYFYSNKKSATPTTAQQTTANTPQTTKVTTSAAPIGPSTLVKTQQALVVGTIVKKDAETVTVTSKDNQATATFKLSPKLMIYPAPGTDNKIKLGSPNKDTLLANQPAAVNLDLVNGEYLVTTITYLKSL